MKLLAVGRDESIGGALVGALRDAGHDVDIVDAHSGADLRLRTTHFDGVILDLPSASAAALAWLRELRTRRMPIGVLTMTDASDVEGRIAAIAAGSDDHIVRPVDPRELVARCNGLMHRGADTSPDDVRRCGELTVDSRKREVRHGVIPIDLTPREWSILEFLMAHVGNAVTKDRMLRSIAGWDEMLAPNAIEVYVSRLRAKLRGTGARISTIRSVGYRLEQPHAVVQPQAGIAEAVAPMAE